MNIKKIVNIIELLSLTSILSLSAMEPQKKTEFSDLPPTIQAHILMDAKPEIEQWLRERMITIPKKLQGHNNPISCLAISPNGKYVITGSSVQESYLSKYPKEIENLAIIWDIETGKPLKKLQGHTQGICCIAVTPDSKKVVTGSRDRTVIIWDIETGEQLHKLQGRGLRVTEPYHNRGRLLAITPDGKYVITGSDYPETKPMVWDIKTGRPLKQLDGEDCTLCMATTPDGKKLITGSGHDSAKIWNIENIETASILKNLKHKRWIAQVAITPDEQKVIGCSDRSAIIWDINTGKKLDCYHDVYGFDCENEVNCIGITKDSKKLITGSGMETAVIWDITTGEELRRLKRRSLNKHDSEFLFGAITCLSITPDDKFVITGSTKNIAIIWNINTGKQVSILQGHKASIWCMALTTNGNKLITCDKAGTAIIWNIKNDQLSILLEDLSPRQFGIVYLCYQAAQKNKKLKLPASLKDDFDNLPIFIKDLITDYVKIVGVKKTKIKNKTKESKDQHKDPKNHDEPSYENLEYIP